MFVADTTVALDPTTQWVALFTAIAVFLGVASQVMLQVLTIWKAQIAAAEAKKTGEDAAASAKSAAEEARKVKQVLVSTTAETTAQRESVSEKLDQSLKATTAIHTLVNNATAIMLKDKVADKRLIAELLRGTPGATAAEAAVVMAEQAVREHEAKQAVVDSRGS